MGPVSLPPEILQLKKHVEKLENECSKEEYRYRE
jgi:hypothetical protein